MRVNHLNIERGIGGNTADLTIDRQGMSIRTVYKGTISPPNNSINLSPGVYGEYAEPINESALLRGDEVMFSPTSGVDIGNVPFRPERVLFAGYYYNHYGHFITESISRLWALGSHLDVDKIIFVMGGVIPGRKRDDIIHDIMPEGVPEVEILEQACSFREVLVPQPGFVIRRSFNENYWNWLREVSLRVLDPEEHNSVDTPLYLSRSDTPHTRRYAYGEKELEEGLRQSGVCVVQPEKLNFADQIRMVAKHKTVIGLEGSQLHSMMFTMGKKNTVQLDFRKVNPNYIIIDEMLGNEAHYPLLKVPSVYQNFVLGRGVDEPYVFDPQKAADAISSVLGVKITTPDLKKDTRRLFAASWINWWSRSAYDAITGSPMARPPSVWGTPPRVWGLTSEQHRSNVECLLAAL